MFLKSMTSFEFFLKFMGKMFGAGAVAGAEIFYKLKPEPHKNEPAPQHCI
jgi:hypothetical protein